MILTLTFFEGRRLPTVHVLVPLRWAFACFGLVTSVVVPAFLPRKRFEKAVLALSFA